MVANVSGSSESLPVASRLGEVIETSTLGYWAESDELHKLPELGALVSVDVGNGLVSYGIVAFGETGGIDPSRRAVRRGSDDLADEQIYARHPELSHVLRTIFRVAAVGFDRDGRVRHAVPPLPVPLHFSVHACNAAAVQRFCNPPSYFALMLNHRGEINPEDVLASHLRWVDETLQDNHVWLNSASRQLARLMRQDYDRLVTILESVDPYVQ